MEWMQKTVVKSASCEEMWSIICKASDCCGKDLCGCGVLLIGNNGGVKIVNVPKSTQNFSGQHVTK